ncbi:MAG: beta-propeller domain-containing protein, partial [Heliobacteriaceae bacterium]|nr:beta-propeller domain-containing protein [Heliobacteriaceae bacterium]
MPKRWFLLLLAAACWFAVSGAVAQPAADRPVNVAIPVYLDGAPVVWGTTPKITAGRLVVPVGDLAAAVNGEVIYDPAAGTVRVEKKGMVLELGVGQAQVRKNGETVTWETAPLLLDGQVFAPLRSLAGALDLTVVWQDSPPAVFLQTGRQGVLPVVGTREKLQALLAEAERTVSFRPGEGDPARKNVQAADRAEIAPGAAPMTGGSGSGDYSRTNLQVAGVDEADLVKTDGEYIYQVNGRRVVVVKAVPPEAMQVVSVLDWGEAEFRPREIYVDDRFLVVIGSSGQAAWRPASGEAYRCPPFFRTVVKAMVYDLQDRGNLQKLREVELTGDYVSSRKVGPALYLVANKDLPYHILRSEDPAGLTPSYRDSAAGNRLVTVGLPEIRYFPGFTEPNYLLVAGLNLEKPAEPLQVDTYLGSGGNIYVSPQNMYITVTGYRQSPVAPMPTETNSQIYKFSLENGRVNYRAKTEAPGRILNQFSLDEYAGYYLVATTTGEI